MKRLIFLLLWPVWVGADTFYVNSGAATGGDGSAPTPWDEFSDITGLSAGDTVCITGEFDETLTPGTSGSSGSLVTYKFDCEAGAGSIRRTGNNNGVTISGTREYVKLDAPDISAGGRCISIDQTTDTTQGHHRITGGSLTDCSTDASAGTSPAIYAATHDLEIDGTTIDGSGDDGLRSPGGVGDIVVKNCIIRNVDQRSDSGDAIQVGVGGGAGNLTVDNCTLEYDSDNKQAILDSGTGTLIIRNTKFNGQGTGDEAIGVNKPSGTCLIEKNYFFDFDSYGIFADGASIGCTVTSNIFRGLPTPVYLKSDATGTWNIYNNSMDRVTGAMYSLGTQTVNLKNNAIDCVSGANCIRTVAGTTLVSDYNSYESEFAEAWNGAGTTYDTLSAWATAISDEANSAVQAPQYIGGPNPTTAEGFRLRSGSPLRAAGTFVGSLQDHGNRRFKSPPSIGAWEAASGDAAEARTARD